MRTDTSGAGYAIYWASVNGKLVVAGDYVTEARREAIAKLGLTASFAEESEAFALDANGDGPIATCYKSGEAVFIKDVASSNMKRKDIAAKYGIRQVAFVPMEGGVMEYGTSEGACTQDWDELPVCPTMPKAEMRKAYENLGASYSLFWQNKDGANFEVVAEHTTDSRKDALKKVRQDDKTFAIESKAFKLSADGDVRRTIEPAPNPTRTTTLRSTRACALQHPSSCLRGTHAHTTVRASPTHSLIAAPRVRGCVPRRGGRAPWRRRSGQRRRSC